LLAIDKHLSLLRKYVTYGQKKFYNIGRRPERETDASAESHLVIGQATSVSQQDFEIGGHWNENSEPDEEMEPSNIFQPDHRSDPETAQDLPSGPGHQGDRRDPDNQSFLRILTPGQINLQRSSENEARCQCY
jgi:hypothetical protein